MPDIPSNILVTSQPNIYYITKLNLDGLWVYTSKPHIILTTPLLFSQIRKLTGNKYKLICKNNFIDALKELKLVIGTKKMLVDEAASVKSIQLIKKIFKIAGYTNTIEKERLIKEKHEIELIKKACRLAKNILNSIKITPGKTEKEIAQEIKLNLLKQCLEPAFDVIVASGKNSAYPHHITSNKVIRPDDIVIVDMGCKYKMYCSDITRTFTFKNTPDRLKQIHLIVKKVQKEVINSIRPGRKACEIHELTVKLFKKYGYQKYFLHSTGHSIGLEVHENFRLNETNNAILKQNMVLTIEPGIYIENLGGARIEDVILVTKNGCEVLN